MFEIVVKEKKKKKSESARFRVDQGAKGGCAIRQGMRGAQLLEIQSDFTIGGREALVNGLGRTVTDGLRNAEYPDNKKAAHGGKAVANEEVLEVIC